MISHLAYHLVQDNGLSSVTFLGISAVACVQVVFAHHHCFAHIKLFHESIIASCPLSNTSCENNWICSSFISAFILLYSCSILMISFSAISMSFCTQSNELLHQASRKHMNNNPMLIDLVRCFLSQSTAFITILFL
jgi:hypothetical protein